jgi:hypothetical protein
VRASRKAPRVPRKRTNPSEPGCAQHSLRSGDGCEGA